jgi:hemerythrin-like domain-containing protein
MEKQMCEYCGCQEVPAIAQLTAEHDTIVDLMAHVRHALARDDRDSAAQSCRQMLTVLGPHTSVEEQALFPAMRAEFTDQIDQLRAEHREIEAVLAAEPTDPDWPVRLLAALHQLREHILKEQDGVFPASLAILTPDDWERLDAVRAASRADVSELGTA